MTILIDDSEPSRRRVLRGLVKAGGVVALLAGVSAPRAAFAKVSPADVGYQPSPKGASRCSTCVNFQTPDACKIVSGRISPNGWCSVYAKKS